MKLVLVALFALFAVSSARLLAEHEYEFLFTNWMRQHTRDYATVDEFQYRYQVWKDNMDQVITHNAKNSTFTLAMNKFGDLTQKEFKARYNRYIPHNRTVLAAGPIDISAIPTSVDWREKGAVTGVKNQGQCGSCWAFSAVASTEAAHFYKTGSLVSLSEEELVDCGSSTGNEGCEGGLMDDAFQWIMNNGGIASEASYPYIGTDGNPCQSSTQKNVATISGYKDVTQNSNSALLQAAAAQVVSVAVEADQAVFQFYSSGVLNDPSCGTNLDHGVTLVGYNNAGSNPYWIVKNSWGSDWGLSGYLYIAITSDQAAECGINMQPSYPLP